MSLDKRRAAVSRAVGVDPVPLMTGLISAAQPNNLFEAREIGALINASVNKLAAVPSPDCASTDVLVSVAEANLSNQRDDVGLRQSRF
jgi:hypothetical protein